MELNEAIAKRRSIRKYQKKEVAKELIDEMITAGLRRLYPSEKMTYRKKAGIS